MKNNVVNLPNKNDLGQQQIVEMLERRLAEAKEGKVFAIAVAAVMQADDDKDSTCASTEFHNGYNSKCFELPTAVQLLNKRMLSYLMPDGTH